MAIRHMAGGTLEYLDEPSPTLDPFGFDEIRLRILYRGGMQSLINEFQLGNQFNGTDMYCIGPQGASKSRFGHIWAEIAYKGFYDENRRRTLTSYSVTTRETELPRTYTKEGGGTWTTYAAPPMVPSIKNPKTGTFWRVRLIDRVVGATMQGVTIGTPSQPPPLPTIQATIPPGMKSNVNWDNLADPTVNYPNGWQVRDFQTNSQFSAGDKALFFWTARFEFVERFSP